ncbi:MAG: VTT domain-containing protein [Halobacteriales archaeon]|nr:VTT domain-containing protein [Halobacteriales archaeon]
MGELAKPGRLLRRLRRDAHELGELFTRGEERRKVRDGLRHPRRMATRRQHAVSILLGLALLAAWAIGTLALRVLAPQGVPAWDVFWGMVLLSWLSAMAVPGAATAGLALLVGPATQAAGVLGATVGGVLGALLVWFLGGEAMHRLEDRKARRGWSRKLVEASERFAWRGTYAALALLVAIPGFPRSIPIYVCSVLRLKLPPFLVAVALGSFARALVVVLVGRSLGIFG